MKKKFYLLDMKNHLIIEYFKKSELDYIKDYSNIIKTQYPQLEFKIIYISKTLEINYFKENNIIILKLDDESINFNNSGIKFINMFEKYKDFLEKIDL